MKATIFESCHSTWIFDTDRLRFRRILIDIEVGRHSVSTAWRPYFQLEAEPTSETFTVVLNADRSRRIRSWRHTADCMECGGHVTAELSLADISNAVGV
jgi:hypothetical protein